MSLPPGQYEVTRLVVFDRKTDEPVAVTTVCMDAFVQLEKMDFDEDNYYFKEINKAEYDNYISMKVVPYREIFAYLSKKKPWQNSLVEDGVLNGI